MFIINDSFERDKDVSVVDTSQMFKVLRWDGGTHQLVCHLEGGAGVVLYSRVLWCGGEITLAEKDNLQEYSGDGNVFLQSVMTPIKLVKLNEFGEAVKLNRADLLAVPAEYQRIDSKETDILCISGTGVLPVLARSELHGIITVTIGEEDTLMVRSSDVLCWSASLQNALLTDNMEGYMLFSGGGTVMFSRGH